MFAILTTVLTTISEPLSFVQGDIILGFRYQYVNFIGLSFQNDITIVNFEFTIIPKIEVKLTSDITTAFINNSNFIVVSFIPLNDTVFIIITNAL